MKQVEVGFSEHDEVEYFKQYLRIKTVHPVLDKEYANAAQFLLELGEKIGLSGKCVEFVEGKKIVVLTLEGSDPVLPAIMLNSHIDVVPVEKEFWDSDPFEASERENGDIVARGTQNMKSVGIQYLMALSRLGKSGFVPRRTLHVTFVPDEEIGGDKGMNLLVQSDLFKDLNIGFALDEGYASEDDKYVLFYGDKSPWWIEFEASGTTGHASLLLEDTAAVKISNLIQRVSKFREEQDKICRQENKTLGDVVSINITAMQAGRETAPGTFQLNVIPSTCKIYADIRIPPTYTDQRFEQILHDWTDEDKIAYRFIHKTSIVPPTEITAANPWWVCFEGVCESINIKLKHEIFPAATDSRYLRSRKIPALGFSPINFTKRLLHQHNEYLNRKTYLEGISIYCQLISSLSSLERHQLDK